MNPFREVYIEKSTRPIQSPKALEQPILDRLLALPDPKEPAGVRNSLLLLLIICYGLEIHQLQRLNLEDIDLPSGTLKISSRRGKPRWIEFDPTAARLLTHWLAIRQLFSQDRTAVFISLHWTAGRSTPGMRLSQRGIRQVVDKHLAALGLKHSGNNARSIRKNQSIKTSHSIASGAL